MPAAYTLIMMLAVATGIIVRHVTPTSLTLSRSQNLGVAIGAFCGAMIGAKLPFVFSDWDGLLSGAAWFANGKTILTGLVGGYFGVVIAKWVLDIRVSTGDSFVVPVAAAIAVGRLACFSAGCCYGTPTDLPWGVVFSSVDTLSRHPTQLYEAAFHAMAAGVLYLLLRQGAFRGQLIKLYIISYVIYRWFSEMLRPEARLWGDLTGYQWACFVIFGLFVWLWVRDAAVTSKESRNRSAQWQPDA